MSAPVLEPAEVFAKRYPVPGSVTLPTGVVRARDEQIAAMCEHMIATARAYRNKADSALLDASYASEIVALQRVIDALRGAK